MKVNPYKITCYKDIEESLNKVDKEIELSLPANPKAIKPALLSLVMVFISSLYRKSERINLSCQWLDPKGCETSKIGELLDDPVWFVCALYADEIYLGENRVPSKGRLNNSFMERSEKVYGVMARRMAQFITIDYSIQRFREPASLYDNKNGNVKPTRGFSSLLKSFCTELVNEINPHDEWLREISVIIHEVFLNTHEHAYKRLFYSIDNKSCRGLMYRHHMIANSDDVDGFFNKNTPENEYIENIRKSSPGTLHLLEVSVFDSGVGFAKTFGDFSGGRKEEVALVKKCFKQGVTSKNYAAGSGNGLFESEMVLRRKKAFVSVTTGRVSIYADFSMGEGSGNFIERARFGGDEDSVCFSGTAFTALIPIRGEDCV